MNLLMQYRDRIPHPILIELIGVASKLKIAMRSNVKIDQETYDMLKDVCDGLDLSIIKESDEKQFHVYISRREQLCLETKKAFKGEEEKTWQLFSYPKCCYESHHKISERYSDTEPELLNYYNFLQSYNKSKSFSHLLNIFGWGRHFLISHFPCSYDCPASVEYAKKLLENIKEYDEDLAHDIEFDQFGIYLILKCKDPENVIRFNGQRAANEIMYEQALSKNLPFDKGNRVVINEHQIKIYKDTELIYTYHKKSAHDGFVIEFGPSF